VIAANALKDGYAELVATFEKSSGHKVATTWAGTISATKRVSDGEVYDLVIIGSSSIDQLISAGKLAAGSRVDFAKTGIGIAVRAGLAKPDVSTSDAVKAAVLAAKSIVYSAAPAKRAFYRSKLEAVDLSFSYAHPIGSHPPDTTHGVASERA
jgi:molybdate transport system substrate-binding protein